MIKVLVVDDSEVVCRILSKEISKAPDMQVVGTAADPYLARDMIVQLRPDVITLDLEMPRMNGLTFIGKLMRHYPLPVIVVSSQTPQGSDMALKALEMGAVEVLGKPGPGQSVTEMGETLVEKIRAAAATRAAGTRRPPSPGLSLPGHSQMPCDTTYQVLAIGASTGGVEAIKQVLAGMPSNCPGIVIAQHMSELFTAQFAKRLNESCTLEVREAAHGDALVAGLALVAPGNRHTVLCRRGSQYFVEIKNGPAIHHHRPSIDVLFHSVAVAAGSAAAGVLMTGMGVDGARGLLAMREAGARTFAQDEESCAVFGMPQEAIRLEAVEKVVPLTRMAHTIIQTIARDDNRTTIATSLAARST